MCELIGGSLGVIIHKSYSPSLKFNFKMITDDHRIAIKTKENLQKNNYMSPLKTTRSPGTTRLLVPAVPGLGLGGPGFEEWILVESQEWSHNVGQNPA